MAKCFSVTKLSESLVAPAEATPCDTELSLSWMDIWYPSNLFVSACLVFQQHGINGGGCSSSSSSGRITTIIRDALSRALVPYYPVAGALRMSSSAGGDSRELRKVACTGEGVWFVEASASATLEEVAFLDLARLPLSISIEDLLPRGHPGLQHPHRHHPHDPGTYVYLTKHRISIKPYCVLCAVQVTEFLCGGFVIGLVFNHAFFDGVGVSTFMKAVADTARGIERSPALLPVWCRDVIPPPPNTVFPPPLPMQVCDTHFDVLDLPAGHIEELKLRFAAAVLGDAKQRPYCSTFDVVAAKFWKCRSRAMKLDEANGVGVIVQLMFAINMRRHLSRRFSSFPSDGTYYGNCVGFGRATAPASEIMRASIFEIVKLIQEAKERAAVDHLSWISEGRRRHPAAQDMKFFSGSDPPYEDANVLDWTKIGMDEVDYGRGGPVSFFRAPFRHWSSGVVCVLVRPPPPKTGVRLLMDCLKAEHLASFVEEMTRDAEFG